MADPVVLPDTLDVSNVSFRSEGMPDYIITEGDTAGTYFDMGAHDSSNDTLLYAEWDVTIQPIKYTVAVDVYNLNSWRVQLYLLTQAGDTVKSLRYKGSSGQKGQFSIGTLDLTNLAAGNYKVRVHAATAWSKMKLKDVIFAADYQGVSVTLPGTLQPAYAELSSGASVANGALAFAPSTADAEYATWNVSFAAAGNYLVTLDMSAPNGHNYGVALLSADGATSIASVSEGGQKGDTGIKKLGVIAVPAAGNYKVKLTNATKWSEAVINSIAIANYVPEYYLVGTMNNWTEAEAYKFAVNPENAAEYMLTTTLAEGDSLKVKSDVNVWFPDNAANYGVDAAHAGEKTVYFRPDGQGGNDWYNGVIYIAPNPAPQPVVEMDTIYSYYGKRGESSATEAIEKGGTAAAEGGNSNIVVGTAQKTNWTIKLNKGFSNANYVGITLNEALKAGDQMQLAAFIASDNTAVLGIDFSASKEAASTDCQLLFSNLQLITTNAAPEDTVFTIPAAAAGAKYIRVYRNSGSTGVYVANITILREKGDTPEPPVEVKYYMKNNWDAAADWTWKEMAKDGDNYKLDSVVFGGTGVNYNTKAEDAGSVWVELAKIAGAKIAAKDTVSFVLNPADSTVTATLIGKYVKPVESLIYKVDFFNRDWSKDTISTATYDAVNQKVLVNIIPGKNDQWQGQLWLKLPMEVRYGYEYDLSFKAKANKTFGGTIVKYQESAEMTIIYDFNMVANEEAVYSKTNLHGVSGGNGILCISFGYAPDSTNIEIYDINIVEHEATSPVAKFYVTGNDAFTVDAGLAAAKAWNPDALPSYGDTLTVALKAGAEYQLKVCVEGTWNTVKGYNDLTEKAAGLIDADGNNHNIGFSLVDSSDVKIIYTGDVFKLEGNFFVAPSEGQTCAEIYGLAKNDTATLKPVTVTYANGKNVYVKDETGAMLLYLPAATTWKAGDVLSGVVGTVDIYNGLYEVKPNADQVAAVTAVAGTAPAPEKVDTIVMADMSKYIIMKEIEIAGRFAKDTASNINFNLGNQALVLRSNFKQAFTFEEGKKYDIIGVVSYYKTDFQVYFVSAEEHVNVGYYLMGSMNNWAEADAYKFTVNPENDAEYMLTTTLTVNDELKVKGTDNNWYPSGMGNNYKVDAAHAGEKTIYFRPAGNEAWKAFHEGGFFFIEANEEPMDSIPTTAPAAPTAAEDDVLAIYCNHYTTNNLNFAISGWAGAYETLTIDDTKIGFWSDMTWECIIDPVNTNEPHDVSGYKKVHVDIWAPKAAKVKFTAEALPAGGYKDGNKVDLVKGWNAFDFVIAEWPGNYDFKTFKCFVWEQYQTPTEEIFEHNPFAFANIYFYEKEAQGLDNTNAEVKAIKVLRNGQIFIEMNGKTYNVLGALVK